MYMQIYSTLLAVVTPLVKRATSESQRPISVSTPK
jgi:hypothetical protein